MRITRPLFFGALASLALGCGSGGTAPGPEDVIPRDTFVKAYFELRVAALRSLETEISVQTRDSILQEMGLTPEDLITFVEVRGEEGQLMRGIWEEVDSLLRVNRRNPQEEGPSPERPVPGDPGREEVRPGVGRTGPGEARAP